jgi:hypothetical protein
MAKTKKSGKSRGQKMTASKRKSGGRAAARSSGGRSTRRGAAKRPTAASRKGARKAARKKTANAANRKTVKAAARKKTVARKAARAARSARRNIRTTAKRASQKRKPLRGGTGREETLAQTPETGRTVKGPTNPMATRRSTGTPAGAGSSRHAPGLDRARRQLREVDETVQGPPSSLDMDRNPSAARSGRRRLQDSLGEHHETSPAMTGGDIDADWEDAYAVGDEAPGGDNPTPDQDRVDDIGKALGVEYQDNEELKGADKIAERDKHRWELDPASSDDYRDRE